MNNLRKYLLLSFLFFSGFNSIAIIYYSRQNGNWNTNATWSTVVCGDPINTGTFPVAGDVVYVCSGHTVTITAAAACMDLTVDGTLTNSTFTLALSGNITVNIGASFNSGTGVHTFSGAAKTIGGTATALTISSLTVSGTYSNNIGTTGLTVLTALAGTGTLTQGINAVLNLGGTTTVTTLTATVNPNTVSYTGTTAAQTIKGTTYYHLTINKTSQTGTLGAATTVNGDLNVAAGILQPSTRNLTVSGTTTVTGTITDNSTTGTNTFAAVSMNGGTITGTVNETYTINGALSLSTGNGTFGACTFIVNGTTTIDAGQTLTLSSITGTKTFSDINVNGIWSNTANEAITFTGNLTVNLGAAFTSGTGVNTFSGTAKTIGGTIAALSISNITVTGTISNDITTFTAGTLLTVTNPGTFTNNASKTVVATTALSGTGAFIQSTNSVLNIGNTSAITTLTATADPNTVNYIRAGVQTVKGTTYHHLIISGSGVKTLGAAIAVNGDLTVSSGTFADGTFGITGTVTGIFTVSAGAIYTSTKTTTPVLPTNMTVTLSSTSTINFNANASYSLPALPASYGNIAFAGGGTKTAASDLTINGNCTVTTGTFNTGGFNISIAGNLTGVGALVNAANSVLTLTGTTNSVTTLTVTAIPNTVIYNRTAGAQTIKGTTYHHLTIDKTAQTGTLGAATIVNGDLNISSGILQLSTLNLTVSGTSYIAGTITDNSTTGTNSFSIISMNGGTILGTVTSTFSISGALNILTGDGTFGRSNFTVSGTTTIGSGRTFTVNNATGTKIFVGLITIDNGGIWNNSANSAIILRGGLQNNGTFTSGTGTHTFNTNSQSLSGSELLTFGGAVTVTGAAVIVTNNNTNASGVTITGNLTGTGTIANSINGIINLGGATISITGLTASANPNSVYYISTTVAQTIKATTYHHLIIDKSTQTGTLGGNITCNGNLTIPAGTLQLSTLNCTVSGTAYITGTIDDNSATGTNTFAGITMTGGSINTSAATAISATSLTVSSGTNTISGTLGDINISGALTVTGTLNITNSAGAQNFGDVTINAIGNYNNSGNSNVSISGNFTNIGSFTSGLGTYTFSGIGKTISGSMGFLITNAVISGTYNFDCSVESFFGTLTVNNALNILKDRALTINTSFTNNGTTLVDAGPNGHSGSLITPASITNNGTCSFITSIAKNNWHGISSPVTNAQIETVFSDLASHNNNFYWCNEANATGYWVQQTSGTMNPGQGYYTYYFSNKYKTFSGTFNSGDVNQVLTYSPGGRQGWNFVGNPYPSAIDWDLAGWTKTNIEDAVYVRNGVAWESYVAGIGSCRYIYQGQGFYVIAQSGGGVLGFSNTIRLHRLADNLKNINNQTSVEDPLLNLKINNNTYSNNTYIRLKNDATTGFDGSWDALKIFSEVHEYPEIFTVSSNYDTLSINSTPFLGTDTIIPIGIKIGLAGDYSIKVAELLNFTSEVNVFLFDANTNNWTNLKQDSSYNFYSEIYRGVNRFFIHINKIPLEISNVHNIKDLNVTSPYCNNNQLYFMVHNYLKSDITIEILDITGKEVYSNNIQMNNTTQLFSVDYNHLSAGYYLLSVKNPVETIIKKVCLIK